MYISQDMHIYIYIYIYTHIYYIYILFTKIIEIIETFWSRDATDIRVLAHCEPKIHKGF